MDQKHDISKSKPGFDTNKEHEARMRSALNAFKNLSKFSRLEDIHTQAWKDASDFYRSEIGSALRQVAELKACVDREKKVERDAIKEAFGLTNKDE